MIALNASDRRIHGQAPLPSDGERALNDAKVARQLRACGLRMTHHRQAVAHALRGGAAAAAATPATADEVHRRILRDGSAVGLASVYRVLHEFERAGIVTRRVLPSRVTAYALDDGSPPLSRVCSRCGAAAAWGDSGLVALLRGVAALHGVPAAHVQLTLTTDCLGCQSGRSPPPADTPQNILARS
jgi:Fur family ferric uptake transcriptional regulator